MMTATVAVASATSFVCSSVVAATVASIRIVHEGRSSVIIAQIKWVKCFM